MAKGIEMIAGGYQEIRRHKEDQPEFIQAARLIPFGQQTSIKEIIARKPKSINASQLSHYSTIVKDYAEEMKADFYESKAYISANEIQVQLYVKNPNLK